MTPRWRVLAATYRRGRDRTGPKRGVAPGPTPGPAPGVAPGVAPGATYANFIFDKKNEKENAK